MTFQQSSRTFTGALSRQPTLVGGNIAPPQASGEACTRAIHKFRTQLTDHGLADLGDTTYEQLCNELLRIQKEQESRMDMMNLSRIKSCLVAMQQFGDVIELFLNDSDAVAFIWGPMKLLLLVSWKNYAGDQTNSYIRRLAHLVTLLKPCWMPMSRLENRYLCCWSMDHCFTHLLT
jgi:hypothetical protein